jgi:hypothetical protein
MFVLSASFVRCACHATQLRQKRPPDTTLLQNVLLKGYLLVRYIFMAIDGKCSGKEINVWPLMSFWGIDDAFAWSGVLDLIE